MTQLRDVMTANPTIFPATATIADAARAMRDTDVGDVLVERDGVLCGIVTDRDIVVRAVAEDRNPSDARLGDICSRELTTLAPADSVEDAVRVMRGQGAATSADMRGRPARWRRLAWRPRHRTRPRLGSCRHQHGITELMTVAPAAVVPPEPLEPLGPDPERPATPSPGPQPVVPDPERPGPLEPPPIEPVPAPEPEPR